MVLDERIQIPHYAVGWGESCSAKLGVQCSLWRNHTRKRIERASKKERGSDLNGLSLYVAREPPSTSLATVLAQKDWSFTCSSFASRTCSLAAPFTHSLESDSITLFVLFGKSFVLHSLAITRRERSNQGAYYHIEKEGKRSDSYYRKSFANRQAIESADRRKQA